MSVRPARRRLLRLAPFLAAALLVAACGRGGPPAPVVLKGSPAQPAPPTAAPDAAPRPAVQQPPSGAAGAEVGTTQVRKGDTLYAISRRHRAPLRELIEVNGLGAPYLLTVGQRLTLPRPREHLVAAGDTVYGISRRYGVDMPALLRLNGIRPPHTITVDRRLRLPAPTAAPPPPVWSREGAALAAGKTVAAPAPGVAAKTPEPAPAKTAAEAGASPGRAASAAAETAASRATARAAEPRPVALGKPPPRSGGAFRWPLKGKILSTFGAKKGGRHNDGINIQARRGAPVRAAENGIVAYAGNELRGFGKLVLVKHADGWMTAYAHNDVLLVARGDRVVRGQVIARAGSTGNVSTPQLHFEIRRGTRAVNPSKHLVTASGPVPGGPPRALSTLMGAF